MQLTTRLYESEVKPAPLRSWFMEKNDEADAPHDAVSINDENTPIENAVSKKKKKGNVST